MKFTEEDLDNCWTYHKSYLVDILNGDYDLKEAREDLSSLIGSEFDKRISNNCNSDAILTQLKPPKSGIKHNQKPEL